MASLNLTFDNITNADLLVGDASVVGDWNTFFDLPTYGTSFSAVTISGNTVQLFGGSGIKVKPNLMNSGGYDYIIQINDLAGCITSVGGDGFSYCYQLTTVNLPECTILYGWEDSPVQNSGAFGQCYGLSTIFLPKLEIAGSYSLEGCPLTIIDLPNLITVENYGFTFCDSLTTLNIPSCTHLGGTVGDNGVFYAIDGNTITLTIPAELMTCNSGNPDGDIQYLQANNTVTINVIDPNALNLVFDDIANADLLVGDASVVGDWNTFFDLPTYGTPFSAVTISGNTVQLFGGSNIETKFQLFSDNLHLLEVWDYANCIITLGDETFGGYSEISVLTKAYFPSVTTTLVTSPSTYGVFGGCRNLIYVYLPNCINLGGSTFYNCILLPSSGLTLPFSSITSLGYYTFQYCEQLTEINFPQVTYIDYYCFSGCYALTTINISSCTNLGGTVGNDNVFNGINGNTITLTIPAELMTCNSGNPDGDIQYLQANNTVTIIEVIPPTPIPYSGIAVNTYYEYTIGMLGDFSGGTAPSGATVPHPIMIGNDGLPYAQMNAVQIGGFGGLNN